MKAILGISAFYHDSAAALVVDGRVVAAAQEERFTRRKHDAEFPVNAVAYCLREAGISESDLDYVVFYDKPLLKFDRLLETYLAFAPAGFRSFRMALPVWLGGKVNLRRRLKRELAGARKARIVFTEHHESHAASAFFPSPFEEAAILTLDGVGEWATATIGKGSGNRIELLREMRFPHSPGLLYSAFTYHCGFKVNSGEYKLMGLAPYGKPRFADTIRERLIDLKEDGSFWMDMSFFNYCQGLTMTNDRFSKLFGCAPRRPEDPIEQLHMDLAASVQMVTEEIVLRMAHEAKRLTGCRKLTLAGGVALNCVANGRLLREGSFEEIWIQPAAGDAGGALGAALFTWFQLLEQDRKPAGWDSQSASLLGPSYDDEAIERALNQAGLGAGRKLGEAELVEHTAALLASGKVVGWFHGRMEFGPRALGARSILGDPRDPTTQARMNLKIKFRESFRPFAPAVLSERVSEWFDIEPGCESPYMLIVAPVRAERRKELSDEDRRLLEEDPDLTRRVNIVRSEVPAITHVDHSARIQTVDVDRHPRFHGLISAFERKTGCPMLVNTSFNVRGEPIVCTPDDAVRCFFSTEMDALVIGGWIVEKHGANAGWTESERAKHLSQFAPD